MKKVGVVMTTYREKTFDKAKHLYGENLYVVDAEGTGVRRGIGPCLLDAWRMALNDHCTEIVQMDAGGSHLPHNKYAMLDLLKGGADMVIGSRFCKGAYYNGNPKRALMSRVAAEMCNLKTGAWFTDWSSGYRAFTAPTLERLLTYPYKEQMHSWQLEVLGYAFRCGMRIEESPISYLAGRSSFNRQVAMDCLKTWWRL